MITSNDVIAVVDLLAAQGHLRKKKIAGDWYTIYCPFHKTGHEKKPSCGVLINTQTRNGKSVEPGFFNCFTCGYKGDLVRSIDLIFENEGLDLTASEWICDNFPSMDINKTYEDDYDPLVPDIIMNSMTNKFALDYIESKYNKQKQYISEEELKNYRYTVPYMYERGLTDEIIERYDIGFDADHIPEGKKNPVPCITFPVRDIHGNCLFIFRRSVEGRYFNYPSGVEKPVYGLYELDKDCNTIMICESAFNMMTCIRHRYNAVALFGTGNSKQINQLKQLGVQRYIIALDPDEAGIRGTSKLKKHLHNVAFISEVQGIPKGKDLNDLTDEEFENLSFI